MKDFEVAEGDVRVSVSGLTRTSRQLAAAGADMQDMRELMHQLGVVVIRRTSVPRRSGALATTLRAGRGKTKAVVRAGSAALPYAPPVHWGWPARNIRPQRFLWDALNRARPEVLRTLDHGIARIIQINDLDP